MIEALANVQPAISVTNSNEVMKTFWFTGKRVMAFNGGMALAAPFESEWTGAVQPTLYPLLSSSGASECTFEETEKALVVKAGASKFKLQSMEADKFNFKMPKFPEQSFPIVDVPKFMIALQACKRSLGSETSETCFKGITMIPDKKTLHLFAYDRVTFTHCTVKVTREIGWDRVVVPTAIVDQLIRIGDGATEMQLAIDEKVLMAKCSGVTLWGALEEQDRVMRPFPDWARDLRSDAKSTIDISDKDFAKKFPQMLERAIVITQSAVDATKTKVTVTDNKIYFKSKSSRGVVEDAIMPGKGQKHHNVELIMSPDRVLAGLELGSLSFTPQATILTNSDNSITLFVSGE